MRHLIGSWPQETRSWVFSIARVLRGQSLGERDAFTRLLACSCAAIVVAACAGDAPAPPPQTDAGGGGGTSSGKTTGAGGTGLSNGGAAGASSAGQAGSVTGGVAEAGAGAGGSGGAAVEPGLGGGAGMAGSAGAPAMSVRISLPQNITYVALGDSITNGWNAGVTCQDWPATPQLFPEFCGDGNSYAVDVARALTQGGHTVSVVNPAQPSKRIGYVDKVELAEVPGDANLVSLYIGTNDWRDIANAGSEQQMQDAVAAFQSAYESVLSKLASKAPAAAIVLLNVPNQKYVNEGHPADELERFDRVSTQLNRWINEHAQKYAVVDNVCDPRTYQKPFRGSNVHPNTAGHLLIAERIVAAVSGEPALLPSSSCPPYLTP